MKNFIYLAIFVAVVAVAVNDGGRIFVAESTLRSDTGTLSSWASNNVEGIGRNQAAALLADRASGYGIELYQYTQDAQGVQLWTRKTVTGLWVVGTYKATLDGVPFRKALGTPIVVTEYVAANFQ